MAWFNTLPEHVQRAYRHKDSVTQIPVLIHLLRSIQYPQTELIYRELSEGFPLMGKLTPGINWHVRQDQKFLEPTPIDEFREKNRTYITDKLEKNSIDEHWEMMLDEILAEVETGRMNGPYQAPDWWPVPLPLPHPDPYIAMAFSIEQTGSDGNTKIRRGEDWRRSGHNATCTMHDEPFHHTPDHFVSLGLEFLGSAMTLGAHCQSGVTIMMAHTVNYHSEILVRPTCCYSRRTALRCGATTSSCLGRRRVSGHTIDSRHDITRDALRR